ncbi:GNAT family protein [Nostoc sp. NIES-2111]
MPKPRAFLRVPQPSDEAELLAATRASRTLHRRWVSPPATQAAVRAYLARPQDPSTAAFFVCRKDTHQIVGVASITGIIQGVFRSGYLGYHAFSGHERQGLMREGIARLLRHAFKVLKLHRLEANIQPGNQASIALAKACGFQLEGYSPRCLKIGGRWRDHERWAILAKP